MAISDHLMLEMTIEWKHISEEEIQTYKDTAKVFIQKWKNKMEELKDITQFQIEMIKIRKSRMASDKLIN
jgi:hypothetical protein